MGQVRGVLQNAGSSVPISADVNVRCKTVTGNPVCLFHYLLQSFTFCSRALCVCMGNVQLDQCGPHKQCFFLIVCVYV